MVFDASFFNTQLYKVRIGVLSIEKVVFGSPLITVANFNYIYIYIYNQSASEDYECGLFKQGLYEGFHIDL